MSIDLPVELDLWFRETPTNPGAILRVSGAWLFLSLFNGILADVALSFLLVVRITGEENMLIWEP